MSETKAPVNPDRILPPGMTQSRYWTICLWDFLLAWFGSRPYRKLWLGMPAVFLGIAVLGGVIARPFYTLERKIRHYQSAATKAIDDKQMTVATMCLEKLWELDPANHQTLFAIAYQLNQLEGSDATTAEYLRRLAPEHEPCYAVAHRWMARTLLNAPAEDLAAVLPKVKLHLEHADALAKLDVESNYLWYFYHLRMGDIEKAAQFLDAAASEDPRLAFPNMQMQNQVGNQEKAKKSALDAQQFFRTPIADDKAELPQYWQQAEVLEFLNQPAELISLTRLVLERFPVSNEAPENLQMHVTFGERLLRIFAVMSEQANTDPAFMVELVQVLRDIDVAAVVRQLDRFSEQQGTTWLAKQFFSRLLDDHDDSGEMAELLGGLAAVREDYATARQLYEVSLQKNPNSAAALNNWAWVLCQSDVELPRALELVNRSLELMPDEHSFRETRGQILVKLERWNEAIEDLKYALNRIPDSKEIHASLAIAYRQAGNDELATVHREMAD